jgi:hypothetical protein
MTRRNSTGTALLPFLFFGVILTGCSSGVDDVVSPDTGELIVEIHDHASPEIVECWITIDAVQARRSHGEWLHVAGDFPHHFDLAELQGGRTRVLGTDSVAVDDYSHIRIHMTAARLVMADGSKVDVPLPAAGLGIDVSMTQRCEVAASSGARVSLDFRIPTSFQHHSDESWTCDPDVVVDGVWNHGEQGHGHHPGGH